MLIFVGATSDFTSCSVIEGNVCYPPIPYLKYSVFADLPFVWLMGNEV